MSLNPSTEAVVEPPEGVLAGEDVPRENELSDREKMMVQELVSDLRAKGEPWSKMEKETLRKKCENKLVEKGVIR